MSGFINDTNPSKLGNGVPGGQPRGGLIGGGANGTSGSGMVGSSERGRERRLLRKAFGNMFLGNWGSPLSGYNNNGTGSAGPFRRATNAGSIWSGIDVNKPANINLPAANQVNGSIRRASLQSLNSGGGGLNRSTGDKDGLFSGNPTYVYDSSDYIRFKKLLARNDNYNDSSFGGSQNSAYSPLMRIRR